MHTFITAMFASEPAAYEGLRALKQLHADGTITLHDTLVVARDDRGEIVMKQFRHDERPLKRTGIGAVLGALAGALVGPIGILVGGSVGILGGAIDDAMRATVGEEYVEDIAAHMQRGAFAVIAEVHERETAAVDATIAACGGTIMRETHRELLGNLIEKRAEARRVAAHRH